MTSVNVTTTSNTVTVTADGQTTVVTSPVTNVVTATTAGPQGATGEAGPPGGAGGSFSQKNLDESNVVDGSLIYYHASSGEYKANSTWTVSTIVTGGNF